MNLIPATNRQAAMALLLLGAGSAAIAYSLIPPPGSDFYNENTAEDWTRLTVQENVDTQQAFQQLRSRLPWGEEKTSDTKNADSESDETTADTATQKWRLTGIVIEGKTRHALIVQGDAAIKRLTVGTTLPDGAILHAIKPDRIQIKKDGKHRWVRLYRQMLEEKVL